MSFDPNQPRDSHGEWTSGSGTRTPREQYVKPSNKAWNVHVLDSHDDTSSFLAKAEHITGEAGERIRQALSDDGADKVVLTSKEEIIAAASYFIGGKYVSIAQLGSTTKGGGTACMRHVLKQASDRNIGVEVQSTSDSAGFYSKLGMKNRWEDSYFFDAQTAKQVYRKLSKQ